MPKNRRKNNIEVFKFPVEFAYNTTTSLRLLPSVQFDFFADTFELEYNYLTGIDDQSSFFFYSCQGLFDRIRSDTPWAVL